MKKFFKWLWYNKEQLLSILYSSIVILASQAVVWTDLVYAFLPTLSPTATIVARVIICVLCVVGTILTIRNICVKYGLSSLATIDEHLAKKAEEAANKLNPEQKKILKAKIGTLQTNLDKAKKDVTQATKSLEEIKTLFAVHSSLVADYTNKKLTLEQQIARTTAIVTSLEGKIAEYKNLLSGKTAQDK